MPILISQLTPPVATQWATVDQVKVRILPALLTAGGAGADSLLSDLIDEASATAAGIVGRPVARAQYSQQLPGYGTQQLRLGRGPLEPSDLTLTLRGDAVDPTVYAVDSPHALLVRTDGWIWELTARYGGSAEPIPVGSDLRPDYASTYWAGYRMPSQPDSDPGTPLPAELRGVVIRMVVSNYAQTLRGGNGVKSLKKADRQIEWYGRVLSDADTQILTDERDLVGP